jgi:hypothetical protein
MKSSLGKSLGGVALGLCLAIALTGCLSFERTPAPAPAPVAAPTGPSIDPASLVGKWGLASYHNEADKARTEKAAAAQCNKPFVIAKGAAGGVMMHVADQTEPQEVFVKKGTDGRNFLGPEGPPGVVGDNEIISFDKGILVTSWVDPEVAGRFGTMVYVRCKGKG